jgi:Ala-tRNA(Pro) deacylase
MSDCTKLMRANPAEEAVMAIAITVRQFLDQHHLPYEEVTHQPTSTSLQAAKAARIAPRLLAKAVLLEDDGHYIMAIVPTARHLKLGDMRHRFKRNFGMATEATVKSIFRDCVPGAVPALGPAYGLETIWDESVMSGPELYFEAGDHEHLIRMRTDDYLRVVRECAHGEFTEPL